MSALTLAEIDEIRAKCRRHVTQRAAISGAIAATPLPMIDAAADLGMLMRMLPKISEDFELREADIARLDPESKAVVYTTLKSLGDSLVGHAITKKLVMRLVTRFGSKVAGKQVAKYAPIVGQATAASISYWLMRHIGLKHVEDCYAVARARAEARMFGEKAVVIDMPMQRV